MGQTISLVALIKLRTRCCTTAREGRSDGNARFDEIFPEPVNEHGTMVSHDVADNLDVVNYNIKWMVLDDHPADVVSIGTIDKAIITCLERARAIMKGE